MKADRNIAIYSRMRAQPLWQLLASKNGPTVIALLQRHLYDHERSLPASILLERLAQDLEELRARGDDFPQPAQAYLASWLGRGYLERRFPAGASEEEYELTTAAVEAIRFVAAMARPHSAATESRLSVVIAALAKLAEDTETDRQRRMERLLAERHRIDQEIEALRKRPVRALARDAALERAREIIALADGLTGDFRRVRDQFEGLNRELRERIVDSEGSRGEVLDSLFAGIDLIADSEAGRTFNAFWRLLTDAEQSALLEESLDSVMARDFVGGLSLPERRFLRGLTRKLLEQGGAVHSVLQTFARGLKSFVQSREYLEQRRLNELLRAAQRAALEVKDGIRTAEPLGHSLDLTGSRLRSLSQWTLYDPAQRAKPEDMRRGDDSVIDLAAVGELVAQSEIDFRALKANIRALLERREQISIADVLERFPAAQGLGSVVGLLALGSRHGTRHDSVETVSWQGEDEQGRRARIPKIYFLRERVRELA